jgi:hypothetical protein
MDDRAHQVGGGASLCRSLRDLDSNVEKLLALAGEIEAKLFGKVPTVQNARPESKPIETPRDCIDKITRNVQMLGQKLAHVNGDIGSFTDSNEAPLIR